MADPDGVLGEIVTRKRADVAARLRGVSLDGAAPTTRSLRAALAKPGARFVMEVKRASPSAGALREGADPRAMARAYRGAADAISVLTDTPFFQGSLDDLEAVRSVYDGPILAKDFVVDVRQVAEARLRGADAVLVMLSVLAPDEAAAVIAEAARLGMDALVEAHSETELRQAVALGAPVIGINNRDLKTLEVDLGVTERLAALVPADRLLVAESGINGRADVERLAPYADAFLVGSALMRAPDPARAARRLAFGRVKVCGLTDAADAAEAAASGANFAGMIFVPGTRRAVTRDAAEPIAETARASGVAIVGVFRNEKVMEVAITARALGLDVVQLHGEEDVGYIAALRNLLGGGTEIWAASKVADAPPQVRSGADRTLFDSQVDGRAGGTGMTFDWSLVAGREILRDAVLAGGLRPENARAAARLGAYALDVNSGVESAPGRKDPARMRSFFEALRPEVRNEVQPCA